MNVITNIAGQNPIMRRMIEAGEAIDISGCQKVQDDRGARYGMVYALDNVQEDMDYCVLGNPTYGTADTWIGSIGRRKSDDKLFAALDQRFYDRSDYECVWLR